MKEQDKRQRRRKQEETAFNQMLLWMAGAVVLEGLALLLKQLYLNFPNTAVGIGIAGAINGFFKVFRFAGGLAFVAGVVWILISLKNKRKLLLPVAVTGVALWLWLAAMCTYRLNAWGFDAMCLLPAVVAVLAAIYFLYQREFFYNAFFCACGIIALYVYDKLYVGRPTLTWAGFALVWVGLAAAALLLRYLSGSGGWMKALDVRVLPANAQYAPMYITCLVVAAVLLAAILLGNPVAHYALFGIVGWMFCLAVYYTVKMM